MVYGGLKRLRNRRFEDLSNQIRMIVVRKGRVAIYGISVKKIKIK